MIYPKLLRFFSTAALVLGFAAAAQAQATRTWVSGVGDDANPCSRTAPCKTFAGAVSKTANGGEISVLDPGGFGAVTITKGLTINGTGTLAGILSAGAPAAVTVNATANDVIILRDISMNGAGTGISGVRYLAGKAVVVDHCWIYGMRGSAASRGIDANLTSNGNLKVIDTVIENVLEDGIHMTSTFLLVVSIDNCRIMNSGQDGIEGVSNIRGAILRTSVVTSGGNGIMTSGSNSQVNLDDVYVTFSEGSAIRGSAGSSIRVSDSAIANNQIGLTQNGGTIDSFQGNSLISNVTPGAFSSTTNKQ